MSKWKAPSSPILQLTLHKLLKQNARKQSSLRFRQQIYGSRKSLQYPIALKKCTKLNSEAWLFVKYRRATRYRLADGATLLRHSATPLRDRYAATTRFNFFRTCSTGAAGDPSSLSNFYNKLKDTYIVLLKYSYVIPMIYLLYSSTGSTKVCLW